MSSQWDTTFAVRYHQANSTIVRDWGTVNSGCKTIVNQPDSDGYTTMDATLAPWRIDADGDGMNVMMTIPVVDGKQTLPASLGKPPVDLSGVTFQIEVILAYVPDSGNKKKLNLRTQAADATGNDAVKSVVIKGFKWPDGVEDPGMVTDNFIISSFTIWINGHIQDFDYVFHTLDMSDKIDSDPEWEFIKPRCVQYACTDIGGVFSTGTFGANTMITGTDDGPHTPPNTHQISPETIPSGCSAGFDISGPVFMREMLLNGAGMQFQLPDGVLPPQEDNGKTFNAWVNTAFEIGPDGLSCSNRDKLVFGNYVDNENKKRTMMVDKNKFRMLLADSMVQVFFDDMYYQYADGITVHIAYSEKSTVGLVDACDSSTGQPKKVFTLYRQQQSCKTTVVKGAKAIAIEAATAIVGAVIGGIAGGYVGGALEGEVTAEQTIEMATFNEEEIIAPSVYSDSEALTYDNVFDEQIKKRNPGLRRRRNFAPPLEKIACEEIEAPIIESNPAPMEGMFNKITPRLVGAITAGAVAGGGLLFAGGFAYYSFSATAARNDFDNYASFDAFTLNAIQAHNWPGADGFRLMTAELTDTSSLRLGLDVMAPNVIQTKQWSAFFSRTAFPLTFDDDSKGALDVNQATHSSLCFTTEGSQTFLSPGGSASDPGFHLVARFPSDTAAGYLIRRNDNGAARYVAYERGTRNGKRCLLTTVEARRAAVFVPVFVRDRQSFTLQELSSGEVLTLPWNKSGGNLTMDNVIDLAPVGTSQYDAAQQIFRMPLWVTRVFESAFFSSGVLTDVNITVSDGTRILKLSDDKKKLQAVPLGTGSAATTLQDSPDTLVTITRIDATSIYKGFNVSVGGKYLKMQPPNTEIVLVDNASEGSPFSPVVSRTDGSQMTFWDSTTNFFVDVQNDTAVGTELIDLQRDPSVTFIRLRDPRGGSVAARKTPKADITGDIIGPVVKKLKEDFPTYYKTGWNVSNTNTLGEVTEWLLSTPENGTGPASNIAQHILDENDDFGLERYEDGKPPVTPVDATHPVFVMQSTVKKPGDSPLKYRAGHSRELYEWAYKMMTSATSFLDITSLLGENEPRGPMLSAMRNAITFLSNTAAAKNVVVRVLMGKIMGSNSVTSYYFPKTMTAPQLLKELVRDVKKDTSKMKVFVGYTGQMYQLCWNHSKIIAADGQRAMVGGHNLYAEYLKDLNESPPFDVSMKLSGLAAADTHRFADSLWRQQLNSYIDESTMVMFNAADMETVAGEEALPPADIFKKSMPDFDDSEETRVTNSGNGIAVLGVGRVEETVLYSAPADQAILSLVDAAESSIYISQQAMGYAGLAYGEHFNEKLMQGLANSLRKRVLVIVYLSAEGTNNGKGYGGGFPELLLARFSSLIGRDKGGLKYLDVRAFPDATAWDLDPDTVNGLNNHAKTILVDMKAFFIGSHNLYPTGAGSTLSEFSYLVESEEASRAYYNAYFDKFTNWAVSCNNRYDDPEGYTVTITEIECFSTSSWFGDGDHIIVQGEYVGTMRSGETKSVNVVLPPIMYRARTNLRLQADCYQFRDDIVNFVWTYEDFEYMPDEQLAEVKTRAGEILSPLARYVVKYTVAVTS